MQHLESVREEVSVQEGVGGVEVDVQKHDVQGLEKDKGEKVAVVVVQDAFELANQSAKQILEKTFNK